jgi:hypothetical protein
VTGRDVNPRATRDLPRVLLRLLLTGLVACAVAYAARYGLVERDDLGPLCDGAAPAPVCDLRMLVIRGFLHGVYGGASIVLAALASWRRRAWLAHGAVAAGVFGMVLYDFTWSGVGVLAGALALARLQGQWPQYAEPEQHAR